MEKISRIHDKFFKQVFTDVKNMRALLRNCLPPALNDAIDYSCLSIDPTNYISPQFAEGYSDVVAKTMIRTKDNKSRPVDLYILVEHKSYVESAIFLQLLWYMVAMWQQDLKNNVPLRLIIPVVFYHGESRWTIPTSFLEQFDVNDEVKEYLLDSRYMLFDTSGMELWDEKKRNLRENLYFFTSVVMMKNAFKIDLEELNRIFRLWFEKEFHIDIDSIQFLLTYLSQAGDIDRETLEKMLNENKLNGCAIMETIYSTWEREYSKKFKQEVFHEGKQEGKQEVVVNAFKKGLPEDIIASLTGFSMKEIRKMQKAWFSKTKSKTTN